MKIARKLITVVAMVAFAVSCTKVENTPQFPTSVAPFSATSSANSATPTAGDSVSNVLTFNWTDPGYAVGLDNSKFVVMVGAMGKDFVSFAQKNFSGVLTGALLGKEINAMALKFGGQIGQPITLDVKVVASQKNNNEPRSSSVLQIAVTPYGDLGLKAIPTTVVCSAATSDKVGTVLSWSTAFNGYTGVKTYQLQYAIGGTSFAAPISSTVTSYTQSYTQLDLNKIALGLGVAGGSSGIVDFRIKASNESGTVEYSNTVSITITTYVAFNSIGLIGDATAGGWNTDTDMYRPDPVNAPGNWRLVTYLKTATYAMQFRADDAWATQWGGSGFPSGVGTSNGGNIPLTTSGYYQVDFNAGTGAYTFTSLAPTAYTTMIIAGDFNGWSPTTGAVSLTADASGHIWTGTISIATAMPYGMKFVGSGIDWYGNTTLPSGLASTSGGNINPPVGDYFVYFNDVSGEYFLGSTGANADAGTPYTKIGLTGDFSSWSTSSEPVLIQNPTNPYKWSSKITLTAGGSKFIDNGGAHWWGQSSPGIATLTGGNITVTDGNAQITFNSATGEFSFSY